MALDVQALQKWVGRTETAEDTVSAFPVAALSATLDRDDPPPRKGDPLPPLWHWLYFLPAYRHSEAGPDGHMRRGGFLPPVPLPRRMLAGSRVQFRQALRVGEPIRRVSTVANVTHKSGRSGELVFVLVRHELSGAGAVNIAEEHDIVYREAPRTGEQPAASSPASSGNSVVAQWQRVVHPDPLLLFRYSALTFNGHRIHYDRRYVTETEGYPGLIVHGPLIATLLTDLVRRNSTTPMTSFKFKAVSPLFDIAPFSVNGIPSADGKQVKLWAQGAAGQLAMDAEATLAV